jgi:hypothetical protein
MFTSIYVVFSFSQVIIEALVSAVTHAHTYYSGNRLGWQRVIVAANTLLTGKDMRRFMMNCRREDLRAFFEESDMDLYTVWKGVLRGPIEYCTIRTGVGSSLNNDDVLAGYVNHEDPGRRFYLALHQWQAYASWLSFHPDEAAAYRGFEVSNNTSRDLSILHRKIF